MSLAEPQRIFVAQAAPEAVKQIRKPEARSAYSDVLATTMREYLSDIFNQPSPPEIVQELKKRHGLVLFEGSVLRGTATEKTGDFDIFFMVDDQPMDQKKWGDFIRSMRDFEKNHPNKQNFSEYLMNRLRTNENTIHYDARIVEIQRRQAVIDKLYGRNLGTIEVDPYEFIHLDYAGNYLQNFLDAINTGDRRILNDTPTRIIVSLLTTTPDLVFEIAPGSLYYYQQRLIESLVALRTEDLDKFTTLYAQLADDFVNLKRSTAGRYPGRDFQLLAEYYLQSGKFRPEHIQTDQLVNIVTRRLTYKAIKENIRVWTERHEVYRKDPNLLMEHIMRKYGIEEGLARDELEKIAKGENLLESEEQQLSPEAQEEIRRFEKRVKLLAAIRGQTTMPSLEEFQKAYLIEAS